MSPFVVLIFSPNGGILVGNFDDELLELKLASGMTAAHRMQDMADVMNLIRANQLPFEYVNQLNPYVASSFTELWHVAQVNEDY